ncbi:hypothetical protein D3C87_77870 [compost metagenome]
MKKQKLTWLDKFAQEEFNKEQMKKEASLKKVADQIVVSPEDVPGAQNGAEVQYNGESFKVVDANFSDEVGPGVVLEKSAAASDGAYSGLEQDPMGLSMGVPATSVAPAAPGQEYHRTKLDIQQTYDNDQDAQYGQSSAPATEQEVAGENAVDRTTVPGHYTKSPGLNSAPAVTPIMDGTVEPVAEMVEEVAVEEPAAELPVVEEPAADVPAEEVPAVEEEEKENKILSALKSSIQKKAKVTRTSANNQIINLASDVTTTIIAEVEDLLEDAEEAVKQFVPARLASKVLSALEEALEEEGIEAAFNKTVTKEALAKTASEEVSEDEIDQVVKKVAETVVAELEDVLKDADEAMDSERETIAEGEEDNFEVEAKLKAMVERKLHAKGIYTRFARTASKPAKKTIAQKIRDARTSR